MKSIKSYKSLFGLLLIFTLVASACGPDDDEEIPQNVAPIITDQSFSPAEDIDDSAVIGVVLASDPDGDALSFSITGTVELNGSRDFTGLFEIDETTGALSITDGEVLDFEDASVFSITVLVSDTELTATASVAIMVTDVEEGSIPFVTKWSITHPPQTLGFATKPGLEYNYNVDWGDGTSETGLTAGASHTYTNYGFHEISITGVFPAIIVDGSQDIRTIEQWGNIEWQTMEGAFVGSSNLEENATDAPNLSRVTNMQGMFSNCRDFSGDLNNWNVRNITNMSSMFENNSPFSEDIEIGDWDVGNVTTMDRMFAGADVFDNNIGNWDVSSVTSMSEMFKGTRAFNQDIGNWDVGNVINMREMFSGIGAFNQNLGSWDVSNVTDMQGMFLSSGFNGDINNWDVSNVTNMSFMFDKASAFNQDIGDWNVSNVTDMRFMFHLASAFNQDIGNWDVSKVWNMLAMFSYAYAFNQDIGRWDVRSVQSMVKMFSIAVAFNQDLTQWDVANVRNCYEFSWNSGLAENHYPDFTNCNPGG